MKTISKILLPLGSAVATVAAVTPLASCGWAGSINLLTYTPNKNLVHTRDSYTTDAAADELFGSENSLEIMKQDILTYLSWEVKNELEQAAHWVTLQDWVGPLHEAKCKLSNLSFTYDKGSHIVKVSGTIQLKAVCDVIVWDSLLIWHKIGVYTLETKHEIHSVPFRITYTKHPLYSDWYYWTTFHTIDELKADKEWNVNRTYSGVAKYDSNELKPEREENEFLYNSETINEDNFTELSLIRWWSYYLNGATHE